MEVEIRVSYGTYKVQIREVSYVEDWVIEDRVENTEAIRNFPSQKHMILAMIFAGRWRDGSTQGFPRTVNPLTRVPNL